MTDPDTKVRDLLSELASEAGPPTHLERRTLRRARRRRMGTGVVSVIVVLGLALGGFELFRAVQAPVGPAGEGTPMPTVTVSATPPPLTGGFAGLWPEANEEALASVQAAVDQGHEPWRLDPVSTAERLAQDVLGYPADDVSVVEQHVEGSVATVLITDRLFGDPVPPITVQLRQLGVTGPTGVWTVTSVSSSLISLDPIVIGSDASVMVSGTLGDVLFDPSRVDASWAPEEVRLSSVPGRDVDASSLGFPLTSGRTFEVSWSLPVEGDPQSFVLWVRVVDGSGRALGAIAEPLEGPVPEPTPSP